MIRIALVGQPNCGKSTIFNHLVGYKANTSNLPGTTVEYLASEAFVDGRHVEIVDLPGLYSLTSSDEAEVESRNFLLNEGVDAILNVVDASLLSRSLELTLSENAKAVTDDCPSKKFVLPLYLEGDECTVPYCCYGNDVDCDLCGAWVVFHLAARLEQGGGSYRGTHVL